MPTAANFSFDFDWPHLIGVFDAVIILLNPAIAVVLALILAVGVALLVVNVRTSQQNKGQRVKPTHRVADHRVPPASPDLVLVLDPPELAADTKPNRPTSDDPVEQVILDRLATGPAHIDDLTAELGLPGHEARAAVTMLSLKGDIADEGDMTYRLTGAPLVTKSAAGDAGSVTNDAALVTPGGLASTAGHTNGRGARPRQAPDATTPQRHSRPRPIEVLLEWLRHIIALVFGDARRLRHLDPNLVRPFYVPEIEVKPPKEYVPPFKADFEPLAEADKAAEQELAPDEIATPTYGYGLPSASYDLDTALAEVEAEERRAEEARQAAELAPDEIATPTYGYGLPSPTYDLDAALAEVEAEERRAEEARQAAELAPDEIATPTYGYGLPSPTYDLDAALAEVEAGERQAEAASQVVEPSPTESPAPGPDGLFGWPLTGHDLETVQVRESATEAPPAATVEPTPSSPGYEVKQEGNWTWLFFDEKPDEATLQAIKGAGARWSRKRRVWYFTSGVSRDTLDDIIAGREAPDQPRTEEASAAPAKAQTPDTVITTPGGMPIFRASRHTASEATLSDQAEEKVSDERAERQDSGLLPGSLADAQSPDEPGPDDPRSLAEVSSQDVPAIGDDGRPGAGDPDSQATDGGGRHGVDEQGDAAVRSLDAGEGGVGDPADGGGRSGVGDEPSRLADAPERGRRRRTELAGDYRITDADQIGVGGPKQKYHENVAAIRLLKQLEAEGRKATPDEQAVLVKYVGWGGLSKVFDPYEAASWNNRAQWKDEYYELKDLLTPDEYQRARGSTANAHYTSPAVIGAMWDALDRMGFEGGRVLEPAAGVGHFFGVMPEDVAERSQKLASELDPISGRITQQLYQSADVRIVGFEESNFPNNFFDLAISNVPFGNYGVHDPEFKRERKFLTGSIHNYFFAKALDKVKPGGVVAFVTSRYTLDSKDARVREYMASQADLVGAIRLPNTAFKENAGTDVTTDILFLRKRAEGEAPSADTAAWLAVVPQTDEEGKEYRLNEYYVAHPEMMMGKMQVTGNMYQESADLVLEEDRDLRQALVEAVESLPPGILKPATAADYADTVRQPPPFYDKKAQARAARVREGSVFVGDDDKVYRRENGFDVEVKANGNAKTAQRNAERIKSLTAVREAAREVLDLNLAGASDAELEAGQARLNAVYDAFSGEHGPLNLQANQRLLIGDPDLPFLLALERYDEDSRTATKAAIFRDRVIGIVEPPTHADSAKDAMLISLNESNQLNWERMSGLTGRSEAELQEELADVLYLNPEGGWEPADAYLSGDVRRKLQAAEAAARIEPFYQRNVEALRAALPRELKPSDIRASLGAGWIPQEAVQQFAEELLGVGGLRVRYIEDLAQWTIEEDKWAKQRLQWSHANQTAWATQRMTALELIDQALNAKIPTVYDTVTDEAGDRKQVINQAETVAAREMQSKIKQRFGEWIWEDQERAERLAARYNEQFNSIVPRQYEGSHLTLPGTAADISLRPHQKDAIWRIVQGGNTLLAHQVGAGKTFTMIGAGMELRRLGMRRKVMHAVPNNVLEQYAADFQRLYPGARVLIVGAEAMSPKQREQTMSRIATEDWDAVVVSHTALGKLPVKDETFNAFLRQEIQTLEDYMTELKGEKDAKKTVKELEKAKKRLEAKLRDRRDEADKDSALTWEELGIDHLFVDEADKFKNLYFPTKRGRVSGIGGSESGRAFDLFIKTRLLSKKGGVTFATGTPIANSVSEMYTMQRYLQYEALEQQGLAHFDAWANMYGDTVTSLEMNPTGSGYRQFTRFARFENVPELLRTYHQVADMQMDVEALGIERPHLKGGKPVAITVPPSPELKAFIKQAEKRAEALGHVDPRDDNMLKIVSDANKAALDMRLIAPDLPDDPNSKVNAVVDRVLDVYRRTTGVEVPSLPGEKQDMAQLVFLDISTPGEGQGDESFSVYRDMRRKLVAGGIAENEVAFIHDAKTDAERLKLFERVNAGEVRVLIGSTEKMGAGTNVQRRLAALHHVDAPWRPRDVEQREGRILRQGNMNPEVEVYRYATEGSFDVYKWQVLETKAKFISQINNGDLEARAIEDVDSPVIGYAEMKALATGNPIIIEKVKVEADLRRYEGLQKAYEDKRYEMQQELRHLPRDIRQASALASSYRAILDERERQGLDATLAPVGAGLFAVAEANKEAEGPVPLGELYGRETSLRFNDKGLPEVVVEVGEGLEMGFTVSANEKRNAARLRDLFGPDLEKAVQTRERFVADLERRARDYQAELDKPFEHTETLRALRERAAAIQAEMAKIEAGKPEQVFDESFGSDGRNGDEE